MYNNSKQKIVENINKLQLSDIYSLMLFILYKTKEVPDYAILSELCFLLDGSNLTRLLTYFEGKTVTFPSAGEINTLVNALLLYQYINIDENSLSEAQNKIKATSKQKAEITDLYLKILPIINNYNINRSLLQKNVK